MMTHSWASGVEPSFSPSGLNLMTSRPTSTLRPLRPTAPAKECTALVLRTECDPIKAIFDEVGVFTSDSVRFGARYRVRDPIVELADETTERCTFSGEVVGRDCYNGVLAHQKYLLEVAAEQKLADS